MKLIPLLIIAVAVLVTAGLYGTLVYTNCDTNGLVELLTDFRDFHSSDGC